LRWQGDDVISGSAVDMRRAADDDDDDDAVIDVVGYDIPTSTDYVLSH